MDGDEVPNDLHITDRPWTREETDDKVHEWRKQFHFLSWEFDVHRLYRSVNDTDWENENLLSMMVIRNPMDRLLSGINFTAATADWWWERANSIRTNNYALRTIMSFEDCCQGANTSEYFVETAKSYLERFTFLIDMDCLDTSLTEMSSMLNLTMPVNMDKINKHASKISARERLNNDTLYEYLEERNAQDIKLYEWARDRTLVKCAQ
jgi:hypothetical protein